MANTSTIHIKTDFDCIVYDYDQELGTTKADTFCSFELRKGEHELTFAYIEDNSISKTITYEVNDVDCDYQLCIKLLDILLKSIENDSDRSNYSKFFCVLSKAALVLSKAAEDGDTKAQCFLGEFLEIEEAYIFSNYSHIKWYTESANNGYARSQYNLGFCYEYGIGIDMNHAKAIEWYSKAAEQGYAEAVNRLNEINNQSKIDSVYYLFFDTETTGLFIDESKSMNPFRNQVLYNSLRSSLLRQPHLVQLSWITTDKDCNIISQHDYIIQPQGFCIPPEATRIHGITTEIAKEKGTPIKEVIEKFMEDVYAANTLVGHNIEFDKKVINTELIRLGLNNEYDDMNSYDFMSKESICTMKKSILYCEIPSGNYYHPYKQPKLQELHKKLFGYEFEDAHNSMSDVTATLKCFKEMRERGLI